MSNRHNVGLALRLILFLMHLSTLAFGVTAQDGVSRGGQEEDASVAALRSQAIDVMWRASQYYSTQIAKHGGYVYFYDLQSGTRWGEGRATSDQIWVQPPGTPTVGLAYVAAWKATRDPYYRDLVIDVAKALMHGQLRSGGWTNCIDFDPNGQRVAQYRGQPKRGKNNSSLDDGQTQSAIRFLVHADELLEFQDPVIHEAAQLALDSLLAAQFPNGAFPQVWTGPVDAQPMLQASYPSYDWRTEGRIKEYWNLYTLNDNLAVYTAAALMDAYRIYQDERFLRSLRQLGDFLIAAQMPSPQPAWAQQYNYQMHPVWARKFEPPAISGHESMAIVGLLMDVFEFTGDEKYLGPIPAALEFLRSSELSDGQLARYYELRTNRPLFMHRDGQRYELTYSDHRLPSHYSWKTPSRVTELKLRFSQIRGSNSGDEESVYRDELRQTVVGILSSLDSSNRWVSTYKGERLVGQPKFEPGREYLSSEVFSRNMTRLAEFVRQTDSER